MRVLGIDPGSRLTGFGIVETQQKGLVCIEAGVIRLQPASLAERLGQIHRDLEQVIDRCQPDTMAVEQVFMSRNAKSALTLGHARGAAIVAGINAGVPVTEYSATEIKQSIVGRGRAAKEQVQHMIKVLLALKQTPQSDMADALACAICHIHTQQSKDKLMRNPGYQAARL